MEYTKLLRIKYNNKIFDIFCDANHRKTFLEVKKENNGEVYYSPELIDLVNLNLIYNTKKEELYSKKYTFKEQLVITGFVFNIGLMIINNIVLHNYDKQIDRYVNIVYGEDYNIGNDNIIYEISELDQYGYEKVSFNNVRETLNDNKKIDDKYRVYVSKFIDLLEEKLPEADLRVFNINLKTLDFKVYTNDDFDKEFQPYIGAFYRPDDNSIYIRDTYEDITTEESTVFHELVHTMIHSAFIDDNRLSHKDYYVEGYGRSANEAMTEIITKYLRSDNWKRYYSFCEHDYYAYEFYGDIYYDLFRLTDYTAYDYINGNILDLQERLKPYDLDYVIDTLDVIKDSEDKVLVDQKLETINEIKEEIVQAIINKNIGNDVVKIQLVGDTYPYEEKMVIKDINKYEDGKIETIEQTETREVQSKCLVRIHDNETVYNVPIDTLAIYPVIEDGNISYRFAEVKEVKVTEFNDFSKSLDENYQDVFDNQIATGPKEIYQDLVTKEELSEDTQVDSLKLFLYKQAKIDSSLYMSFIDIDMDILNNQQFIGDYNSRINLEKLEEKGITR